MVFNSGYRLLAILERCRDIKSGEPRGGYHGKLNLGGDFSSPVVIPVMYVAIFCDFCYDLKKIPTVDQWKKLLQSTMDTSFYKKPVIEYDHL